MNTHQINEAWVPSETEPSENATSKHEAVLPPKLTAKWRQEHRRRSAELKKALIKDSPGAAADERLVYRMAANDAILAEVLADSQLQLTQRINLLIDFPVFVSPGRSKT